MKIDKKVIISLILLIALGIGIIFISKTYKKNADKEVQREEGAIKVQETLSKEETDQIKATVEGFIKNTLNLYYPVNNGDEYINPNAKIYKYYLEKRNKEQENYLKSVGITSKDQVKNYKHKTFTYRYLQAKDDVADIDIIDYYEVTLSSGEELTSHGDIGYVLRMKKVNGKWLVDVATINSNDKYLNKYDNRENLDIFEITTLDFNTAKNKIDAVDKLEKNQ